jgi:hypothetical protein
VEEYDRRVLYSMLLKSHNHLRLIGDVAFSSTSQDVD